MQIKQTLVIFLITFFLTITFPMTALAKEINLYDQPIANAKVVDTVDLSTGIIPIFTPKEGGWIKIADPRNGNVGWVKSTDLSNTGTPATITFTQKIINDGKGENTYQVIEYGNKSKDMTITTEQSEQAVQKIQARQQAIQESIQKAVQKLMNDVNNLYMHQWDTVNSMGNYPVIMPIVIIPAEKIMPTNKPTTNPKTLPAGTNNGAKKQQTGS